MTAVPTALAVMTPVPLTIDATDGWLLLQVPGVAASVSVEVTPLHKLSDPRILPGKGLTVTTVVIKHDVGTV